VQFKAPNNQFDPEGDMPFSNPLNSQMHGIATQAAQQQYHVPIHPALGSQLPSTPHSANLPENKDISEVDLHRLRSLYSVVTCCTLPTIILALVGLVLMSTVPEGRSDRLAWAAGYAAVILFASCLGCLARKMRLSTDGRYTRDFGRWNYQSLRSWFNCAVAVSTLAITVVGLYIGYFELQWVFNANEFFVTVLLIPFIMILVLSLAHCCSMRTVNNVVHTFERAAGPSLP
jgi:hypothetical protein